jgi:hypothetical protein
MTRDHPASRCCCDCDGTKVACTLDCPTRPVFQCGQILSDGDLNALTGWVADRLRLVRLRAGWGVVCGLEVRCDLQAPNRLWVLPGYAIGCCGDDLVLCEEACIDLGRACAEHPGGCAEPHAQQGEEQGTAGCVIAGRIFASDEIFRVDIALDPAERACAHRSDACSGEGGTKGDASATAVRERARPDWRWPIEERDPAERWQDAWRGCKKIAEAVLAPGREASERRALLHEWLQKQPLRFCWLHEIIRCAEPEQLQDERWLAEVLFWLVVDCRLRLLECPCHECTVDDRVRLARVWVRSTTDQRRRRICQVLHIDMTPPNRRPLGLDCPPHARAHINAAALGFWRAPEEARRALVERGVEVAAQTRSLNPPDDLEALLAQEAFLGPRETARLLVVASECFSIGERVVGFGKEVDGGGGGSPRRGRRGGGS